MTSHSHADGIAIIGMACLFPKARDLDAFWQNILGKVDAVTDPPPEAWDADLYFDADSTESDRVYCKRGGYLGNLFKFDPIANGVPPIQVGGEPDQWLALQIARDALADAGYTELDETTRHRTEVILGRGATPNGGSIIPIQHGLIVPQTLEILRTLRPELTDADIEELRQALKSQLPAMGPELAPGLTPNIIVGRIANRLDLMGPSYTVDAACASSLIAVRHAVQDLDSGDCDLALAGGSHVWTPVPMLSVFCQLGALSHHQQIRPFDKEADGTILGEGLGMLVLKRLADAERDGDRIYSVIRGLGVASDGRATFVMAPRVEGEELAIRRAYENANVDPASVGLIEAHGTGTPVGDVTEVQALARVFGGRKGLLAPVALGSVKSMISHTIPAAGVAGIIKTSLALYHKMLPPTLNVTEPNPRLKLEETPFYINTETRPWIHGGDEPRRAGVSAFGFGGINAHVVLEEYRPHSRDAVPGTPTPVSPATRLLPEHRPAWDSEVCVIEATSRSVLVEKVRALSAFASAAAADASAAVRLEDVAFTLARALAAGDAPQGLRLAIVASSLAELAAKLDRAADRITDPDCRTLREAGGIYFAMEPLARQGKLAFLFPGEGAQYAGMLSDLCLHFPAVRACFDRTDAIYAADGRSILPSDYIFPRPVFSKLEGEWAEQQLLEMDGAVAAVLTADDAMLTILQGLGVRPDAVAGHSSGEFAAVVATGVLGSAAEARRDLSRQLMAVYEQMVAAEDVPPGVLLAIGADRDSVEALIAASGADARVAMDNCPHQVIVATDEATAASLHEAAAAEGLIVERLAFNRPYHTPQFSPYTRRLRAALDALSVGTTPVPVYSCATAAPFPDGAVGIRDLMADQWQRPVEFRQTIEALYDDGVRLFVEVGPRGNLTAFTEDILRGRSFAAIAANVQRRSGITQLNHLAGILAVQGVAIDLSYLFSERQPRLLDWDEAPGLAASGNAAPMILRVGFPGMHLPVPLADRLRQASAALPAAVGAVAARQGVPAASDGVGTPPAAASLASESAVAALPPATLPASTREVVEVSTVGIDGARSDVAHTFFDTMSRFLQVQEGVMKGLLRSGAPATSAELVLDAASSSLAFPLLGTIVSEVAGQSLVARRLFDPDVDPCLREHSIGRDISVMDSELRGLTLMPLALMLEIAAEAAAALVPGWVVTGALDARVEQLLAFDSGPLTVETTATAIAADQVRVRLQVLGDADAAQTSPVFEATLLLGDAYPEAGPASGWQPDAGHPSRFDPSQLYEQEMFHGRPWQTVQAIQSTGSNGIVAEMATLAGAGLLANAGHLQIDTALIDGAGQVLAFWTHEHLAEGRNIFPFHLDALQIYSPPQVAGERLLCNAVVGQLDSQMIAADIELLDAQGRLRLRLQGWRDKRVYLPERFRSVGAPRGFAPLTEGWPEAMASQRAGDSVEARQLRPELPPEAAFFARVWAARSLNRAERAQFRRLAGDAASQIGWLGARQAAKEATIALLQRHLAIELLPADVEIKEDAAGVLSATGAWAERLPGQIVVAMTQTDGWCGAIVGLASAEPAG